MQAQDFDKTCILEISEIIHCVQRPILSREEKGGSTASQKATSIAAVGLFVLRVRVKIVTIVCGLDSSSFQNRSRRAGGMGGGDCQGK